MRTTNGTPGGDDPGPELQWLENLGTRLLAGALELVARLAVVPVVVAAWLAALLRRGNDFDSRDTTRGLPRSRRATEDDR